MSPIYSAAMGWIVVKESGC